MARKKPPAAQGSLWGSDADLALWNRSRKPGLSAMTIDLRTRPLGTFFGGKVGATVPCDVCGAPATQLTAAAFTGAPRYAHRLVFSLDERNDPTVTPLDICEKTDPPGGHHLTIVMAPSSTRRARARARARAKPVNDNDES